MIIKMLTGISGSEYVYAKGAMVKHDEKEAKQWIAKKIARACTPGEELMFKEAQEMQRSKSKPIINKGKIVKSKRS